MGVGAPISHALVAVRKMDVKTEVNWGQRNLKKGKKKKKTQASDQKDIWGTVGIWHREGS